MPTCLLDTVAPSGGLQVDLKSDASSGHVDPAGAVAGPSIGGHSGVSCAKSLVVIGSLPHHGKVTVASLFAPKLCAAMVTPSEWCGEDASSRVELIGVAGVSANFSGIEVVNLTLLSNLCPSGDGFLLAALVPGGQLRVEPEDGLRVEQTRPVQRAGVGRGGRGNTEEKM